ncbi:MAG: TonB-dependent receptor, partial [Luteimonas sp.]|nr:TonB-dependent receptor [Luteimonas sp.]
NDWGKLTNVLRASYSHKFTIDGGADLVRTQGAPAIRATLLNTWQRGDWNAGLNANYIGANGSGNNYTEHYTTYDAYVGIELPWNAKATFGVNNLTDKMPQIIAFGGRPYNFALYDIYGRTPYIRYEQRF